MSILQFPEAIDNSMRKELVKCQKLAHYKFEKGLTTGDDNENLIAGGAFAAGCEATRKAYYLKQKSMQDALSEGFDALSDHYGSYVPPPPKKYKTSKTKDRMLGALAFYFAKNNLDEQTIKPIVLGERLGIEMSFAYNLPLLHPDTGFPLKYVGRYDMLGIDDRGQVWVVDEKTTGEMGDAWVNQWMLDSQQTGYCWAARKQLDEAGMGDLVIAGALINGVAIRSLSNEQPYEHRGLFLARQQWEVDRWYRQLLKDVTRWKQAYVAQDHDQVLDHACALYNNPCVYAPLCKSANPAMLEPNYKVMFWNPMAKG